MSRTKRQVLDTWKPIEAQLRSVPYRLGGADLSPADSERWANALVLWCLLISDLVPGRYTSFGYLTDWIFEVAAQDVASVISDCKSCVSNLRRYNPHMGALLDATSFKHWLFADCSLGLLLARPVSVELSSFSENPYDAALFYKLNSFFSFISRLTLRDCDELEDAAEREYVEYDESLATLSYNATTLLELRDVLRPVCENYTRSAWPRHSSGATAEVRRGGGKWRKEKIVNTIDLRTAQFLTRRGYPLPADVTGSIAVHSKLQFVPKSLNEKRPVCMEPTSRMWLQHAVDDDLRAALVKCPEFRINFRDQGTNRHAAMRASRLQNAATIDLSKASDSVTLSLVRAIFQGPLLWDLLCSRTACVETPTLGMRTLKQVRPRRECYNLRG